MRNTLTVTLSLAALAVTATLPLSAGAQRAEPPPPELEGIGITEHLNAPLPLDARFRDENGQEVTLGRYFGDRPVVLALVYYRCPMLCGLVLQGMLEAIQPLSWTPGQDYEIVTVSIDPAESPTLAKAKKYRYIRELGRPEAAAGWHFLTGSEDQIRRLAEAVGFRYRWNPDRQEFMHAAAIYVCTPEGRLSRYLYGIQYEPQTLRLALLEASQGRIGSPVEQILMWCYHYDAEAGRYTLAAWNLMRAGGALTVILIGTGLGMLWLREARRRRQHQPAGTQQP